jgi:TPR repeat protein
MKRVEANDAASIGVLGNHYHHGLRGFQQDHAKAIELYARAAELGFSKAHINFGMLYHEGGNMKKAKLHFEASAMAKHNFHVAERAFAAGVCVHSFECSGSDDKCPFCNSDQDNKTDEERVGEVI